MSEKQIRGDVTSNMETTVSDDCVRQEYFTQTQEKWTLRKSHNMIH